ncbi:ion transport protein domain-containing protein [Ditylenchus destructor]|uniref:Ion transport protein domain-containing protein n=1 Tax=Ditylenchus destructor TaxID=166010 RepID=A0AAD4N3C7_9BILA|nr:ion transport protein domain-containing protein [Ditylenchus destructor]
MTQDEIISLNIGGSAFKCRASLFRNQSPNAKLAHFVDCPHEARLLMCDSYFQATGEYFFERSAHLFKSIYQMYVNGGLHRPMDVCEFEFSNELAYWGISEGEMSHCCIPRRHHQLGEVPSIDEFNRKPLDPNSETWRQRIFRFCEGDGTLGSTIFTFLSICFVLISVLGLVLGSVQEFQVLIRTSQQNDSTMQLLNQSEAAIVNEITEFNEEQIIWEPHPFFTYLETTCIIWFSIEYFLRFSVAPRRCQFMFQLMNIVDLIAIIPFYLEMFLALCGFDVESLSNIKGAFLVVRILRVLRVVRILKLGRYSSGMRTFALTLRSSARQLGMMGMVLFTGVIFFSTLLYFVEKDEPQTPFTSIPAAFWWAIVTMSTVGYGDYVPVTIPGKLIASGAILSGVLVLALPITIIVDNFMKVSGSFHSGVFGQGAAFSMPQRNPSVRSQRPGSHPIQNDIQKKNNNNLTQSNSYQKC